MVILFEPRCKRNDLFEKISRYSMQSSTRGGMMTGQANGKGIKGGNPNIPLGMHNPSTERMPTLRSGALYGGAVYKGQATFYGHNSERRLHGVQNKVHRSWPIKTTEYFPERNLPSRGYGYSGSYHSNYLYF